MHYHLTLGGTECGRIRTSPEPSWRRYRDDNDGRTVLGLAGCNSPVVTDARNGTEGCSRMIIRSGGTVAV